VIEPASRVCWMKISAPPYGVLCSSTGRCCRARQSLSPGLRPRAVPRGARAIPAGGRAALSAPGSAMIWRQWRRQPERRGRQLMETADLSHQISRRSTKTWSGFAAKCWDGRLRGAAASQGRDGARRKHSTLGDPLPWMTTRSTTWKSHRRGMQPHPGDARRRAAGDLRVIVASSDDY